jgi:hypothetical protein
MIRKLRWIALILPSLLWFSQEAAALCVRDPLDGAFFSTNRETRNLLAMEYQQFCNDTIPIPCDESGCTPPPPPPDGRIRLQGSCTPISCDWGWADVRASGIWKVANLDQGFAIREIWVRWDVPGNFAEVVTRSQYRDGRPSREDREYFRKTRVNIEPNSDRPGSDYRNFNLSTPDFRLCFEACNLDTVCQAYTYVPPGVQGPQARCWLKNAVPGSRVVSAMVSGYVRN